jgi:hypothetical protein
MDPWGVAFPTSFQHTSKRWANGTVFTLRREDNREAMLICGDVGDGKYH